MTLWIIGRTGRAKASIPDAHCVARSTSTRHLAMALFGRKKTTIGLDIGSGLIKVAVIDHGRGEPELTKVAIMPLLATQSSKAKSWTPAS